MTERYPDRASIAGKIQWEGGILESVDYGLHASDMPEGDTELIEAWQALETAYDALGPHIRRLRELLPEDSW